MIQRPQTVLLFVTAVLYIVMAFAPLWTLTIDASMVELSAAHSVMSTTLDGKTIVAKENNNIYLLACLAFGAILSIVTIFFFKDRSLQAKLSAFNSLIITIFIGLCILFAIPSAREVIMSKELGAYSWGFYLSIGVILCNFVANKLIRKDEALVKSVDRIR